MEYIKSIWNTIKSNWYIREPVYNSSVRAPRNYEGWVLAPLALSFFVVPLVIGLLNVFSW
jgi:hypothetical protein